MVIRGGGQQRQNRAAKLEVFFCGKEGWQNRAEKIGFEIEEVTFLRFHEIAA